MRQNEWDSCTSGCFEQKLALQYKFNPISDVKLKETILKNRWFIARQDNNGSMTTFFKEYSGSKSMKTNFKEK